MKQKSGMTFLILLGAWSAQLPAQSFYKWVDAEGVTHYSQIQPKQAVDHIVLDIAEDNARLTPENDYYSVQNQLDRLQTRRARERAEKQRIGQAESVKVTSPDVIYIQASEPVNRYYLPVHYSRYLPYGYNENHHQYKHQSSYSAARATTSDKLTDKPHASISQKKIVNRSAAVFSVSR